MYLLTYNKKPERFDYNVGVCLNLSQRNQRLFAMSFNKYIRIMYYNRVYFSFRKTTLRFTLSGSSDITGPCIV